MDSPSITPPAPIIPPQKRFPYFTYLLIALSVLLTISIAVIVYLVFQNIDLNRKVAELQANRTQLNSPISTPESQTAKNNAIVSIDDIWDLYTNNKLGFSMKIPKNMYHSFGACEWNDSEKSYRPKLGSVPVSVFELQDRVFISSKYFYELGGETTTNGVSLFSKCDKVDNSIARLQDKNLFQQQEWEIIKGNIQSEAGLEGFIKDNYGSGCKVGEKKPAAQSGVFDVAIDRGGYSDPQEAESHGCLVNYIYVLKYSAEKSKAFTWKLGMSAKFLKSPSQDSYDTDMTDSFKFTD